jgi:tRNA 2-thiocytidine biosynthesis protein TtcA
MTKLEKRIARVMGKTIFQYRMIEEGDRVLAAVSGGKDSLTMLYNLARRKRSCPVPFEVEAFHLSSDFCACCAKKSLTDLVSEWGVPFHSGYAAIMGRLKPGQKMNCYWCSTQRRIELIKFARANGFNKIALGHHLDDIIETFMMNVCYKGEMSTMLPIITYDKYPSITIIRPLAQVREEQIIQFAIEKQLDNVVCKCPYGKNSKRKIMKATIGALAKDNKLVRYNMFAAMHNVNPRYLCAPVYGQDGTQAIAVEAIDDGMDLPATE